MFSAFADDSNKESFDKIRLDDHLLVEWDDDRGFVVTDENEDTHRRLKTSGEKIVKIWNLGDQSKFGSNSYGYGKHLIALTAGNSLYIFDYHGSLKGTIDEHESDLVDILFLKGRRLLTLSDDGLIGLWQLPEGQSIALLQTDVASTDALAINERQEILLTQESQESRIWDFRGNQLAGLKGIQGKVKKSYFLEDGRLLTESVTSSRTIQSLWDQDGSPLCTFPENVNLESGYIELPEGKIAISLKAGGCKVYSRDGNHVAEYAQSTKLTETIGKIANAGGELQKEKAEKPSILDYEHINNPFPTRKRKGGGSVREEVEKQQIYNNGSEESQKLWDFFNRPRTEKIQKALLKTIKNLRLERENLDQLASEQDTKIGQIRNHIKLFGVLSVIALAAAPLAALENLSYTVGPGAAFLVLCGLCLSRTAALRNARHYRACVAEIRPGCDYGIEKIKNYRQSILEERPDRRHKGIYSGEGVQEIIERRIHRDLKQKALDACGIEQEDIVTENREPVVMHDGALYQNLSDFVKKRLNWHNLYSFWQVKSGDVLYATEYIQFIFLGKDKIDTYVTVYDFIQERSLDTAVQSFYYRDVTNISKREVERNVDPNRPLPITLISISVSSGEAVEFSIADENTFIEQDDGSSEQDTESSLEELEREYENLKNDEELSEEEREEELSRIEDMMTRTKGWSRQSAVKAAQNANKIADDAVRAIRSQLRRHKENSDV